MQQKTKTKAESTPLDGVKPAAENPQAIAPAYEDESAFRIVQRIFSENFLTYRKSYILAIL